MRMNCIHIRGKRERLCARLPARLRLPHSPLPQTNLAQVLRILILKRLLGLPNLRLQHALETHAFRVSGEHQIQRLLRDPTSIDQGQRAGLVGRAQLSSVCGKLLGLLPIHDAQDVVERHLLGVVGDRGGERVSG